MDYKIILSNAIRLATELHEKQVDKAGQPYILHPLRVMLSVDSIEGKILAVLHDVKEDFDITDEELMENGIPEYLVKKLDLLTKKKKEDYFDYILRAKSDIHTKEVKNADLDDNMNLSRMYPQIDTYKMYDIDYLKGLDYLAEKDLNRFIKYTKAKAILNE